jgi:transketolase
MKQLQQKAALVRKWSLISTSVAGSGHPTSCLSAADIATVLFDSYYTFDLKNPHELNNDRFVLSKGHAAPLLYTLYAISGAFPLEHLKTLRKIDSDLEGHPTPHFKYTEAATGSLGQGLSVAAGMAFALAQGKSANKKPNVYCVMGDGELAEGSVWEAANFASHYKLENLIAIADINGLGQSQATMFNHHIKEYSNRFKAFGWEVIEIDGHNLIQIDNAFAKATKNKSGKPVAIVAKTEKGKGISFLEGKDGWHGKPLKNEDLEKALKELGEVDDSLKFTLKKPAAGPAARQPQNSPTGLTRPGPHSGAPRLASPAVSYKLGEQIATREVYGQVLAELGKHDEAIMALDGDTKNSTYSMDFLKAFPDRFIECFIAEQNMAGVAVGLSKLGHKPFVSTFAAFLTRAFDQIRMAAVSQSHITFVGSHSGVSIGEDGPSQMGLEDIAQFSVIPGSTVLHPSDATSTAKLLAHLPGQKGISYLRTLRPKTSVLYSSDEEFPIGGSKILRESKKDLLTIVACGITVHEALKAYEILVKDNIHVRILDCYSLKPIDNKTLKDSLVKTKKKIIVTVEDHYEHGGLGDLVLSALAKENAHVEKMAVTQVSRSGEKDELLKLAGIDAESIVKRVKSLI